MRQQTGLRGCQIYGVAGRPIKQIAAWIKAKSGEAEIVGRSARHRPAATSDPHDPLDRLVQADDVDRCGNTIRCAGNAVIPHLWLFRTAHHQYWNIGPPPDNKGRIGAGRRRAAEIEDDHIGAAAADQVKKWAWTESGRSLPGIPTPAPPGIDKSSRANNMVVAALISS
jgi:hypothetical protein